MAATKATQVLSIGAAFASAGAIATLSLFDVPEYKSQPASRSLPMVRWMFSRGSHVFPTQAMLSAAGFAYLATAAIPSGQLKHLFAYAVKDPKVGGYLAAAAFAISIAPWTALVMVPTNFELIAMNERLGGAFSAESAQRGGAKPGDRKAEASVDGKSEGTDQFKDLSGPQSKTTKDSTEEDDRKKNELLDKFAKMNNVRAVGMAAAGIAGLLAALA